MALRGQRHPGEGERRPGDVAGLLALAVLAGAVAFAHLPESYVYRAVLPLVTIASLVITAVVVVPGTALGRWMSWRPLVEIGKRSYGLYLWHWPIFVVAGTSGSSVARVAVAIVATVVFSELCYRYIETPVRRGVLGRWWARTDRRRLLALAGGAFLVVSLGAFYRNVTPFDAAAGGEQTTFSVPVSRPSSDHPNPAPGDTVSRDDTSATVSESTPSPSERAAPLELPVDVGIVGDSQAHSLAVNLPAGIESTFAVNDGSLDGCSVYESGNVVASLGFRNDFGICAGWRDAWAQASNGNEIVLVVLGAWDVFDLEIDGQRLSFASPEWDAAYTSRVQQGIDAINSAGAKAALLEVACMRPVAADGAGVPALAERGDDTRVAHVNELLRGLAADNPDGAAFVEGPDAWCDGSPLATDTDYRWDGVHVYVPGANLIYETIAPSLLALASG